MHFRKTRILQTLLLSALLAPLAACGDSTPEAPEKNVQKSAPAPSMTQQEELAMKLENAERWGVRNCEETVEGHALYSTDLLSSEMTGRDDTYIYSTATAVNEYEPEVFTKATATCAYHIMDVKQAQFDVRDEAGDALQPSPRPEITTDHYALYCEARYKRGRFLEEWYDEHGIGAAGDLQVGDVLVSDGAFIVSPYAPHESPADPMRAIGENRKPPAGTTMEILHKVKEPGRVVTYFVGMPEYNSQGWVNSASFMDWYNTPERFQVRDATQTAELKAYLAPYIRQLVVEHGFHYEEFVREGGKNKEWHQRCIDEERARDKIIDDTAKAKWNATKITVPNKGS